MTSIRQVAAKYNPASLAAAKRALKECGMKQTLAPEVMAEMAVVKKARDAKLQARVNRHRRGTGRPAVTLPAGTPAQRLAAIRKGYVRGEFNRAFRQPAHGSTGVILTDDPAKVGIVQCVTDDWDLYAKSYRHGPARVQDTTITAPAKWISRVQKRGIAILDGMMTLDAAVLEGSPDGVTLYAARWAEQGRGTSVNVSNGIIAVSGEYSYHAFDANRALAGLKRKIKNAGWRAEVSAITLDELVSRIPNATVKLSDALAIGACENGIKSWCYRVGISYEVGEATVSEVYAAYLASPAPEARGAILHAARRVRKHLFAAAA